MWSTIGAGLTLLSTLVKFYLDGKKNQAELDLAYNNYAIAKSRFFGQSADERESFEEQKKRMDAIKQQQKEQKK